MFKRLVFDILIECQSCRQRYTCNARFIPGTRTIDWNALTGDVVRCPRCHENDGLFLDLRRSEDRCGPVTWFRLRWAALRGQGEAEVNL